jgi:hypothetical protein
MRKHYNSPVDKRPSKRLQGEDQVPMISSVRVIQQDTNINKEKERYSVNRMNTDVDSNKLKSVPVRVKRQDSSPANEVTQSAPHVQEIKAPVESKVGSNTALEMNNQLSVNPTLSKQIGHQSSLPTLTTDSPIALPRQFTAPLSTLATHKIPSEGAIQPTNSYQETRFTLNPRPKRNSDIVIGPTTPTPGNSGSLTSHPNLPVRQTVPLSIPGAGRSKVSIDIPQSPLPTSSFLVVPSPLPSPQKNTAIKDICIIPIPEPSVDGSISDRSQNRHRIASIDRFAMQNNIVGGQSSVAVHRDMINAGEDEEDNSHHDQTVKNFGNTQSFGPLVIASPQVQLNTSANHIKSGENRTKENINTISKKPEPRICYPDPIKTKSDISEIIDLKSLNKELAMRNSPPTIARPLSQPFAVPNGMTYTVKEADNARRNTMYNTGKSGFSRQPGNNNLVRAEDALPPIPSETSSKMPIDHEVLEKLVEENKELKGLVMNLTNEFKNLTKRLNIHSLSSMNNQVRVGHQDTSEINFSIDVAPRDPTRNLLKLPDNPEFSPVHNTMQDSQIKTPVARFIAGIDDSLNAITPMNKLVRNNDQKDRTLSVIPSMPPSPGLRAMRSYAGTQIASSNYPSGKLTLNPNRSNIDNVTRTDESQLNNVSINKRLSSNNMSGNSLNMDETLLDKQFKQPKQSQFAIKSSQAIEMQSRNLPRPRASERKQTTVTTSDNRMLEDAERQSAMWNLENRSEINKSGIASKKSTMSYPPHLEPNWKMFKRTFTGTNVTMIRTHQGENQPDIICTSLSATFDSEMQAFGFEFSTYISEDPDANKQIVSPQARMKCEKVLFTEDEFIDIFWQCDFSLVDLFHYRVVINESFDYFMKVLVSRYLTYEVDKEKNVIRPMISAQPDIICRIDNLICLSNPYSLVIVHNIGNRFWMLLTNSMIKRNARTKMRIQTWLDQSTLDEFFYSSKMLQDVMTEHSFKRSFTSAASNVVSTPKMLNASLAKVSIVAQPR